MDDQQLSMPVAYLRKIEEMPKVAFSHGFALANYLATLIYATPIFSLHYLSLSFVSINSRTVAACARVTEVTKAE